MKPEEYRGMSDEQLALTLKDVVKNLFHLRFQSATERLETPSEIRKARREVARIKTIIRERELAKTKQETASKPKEAAPAKPKEVVAPAKTKQEAATKTKPAPATKK
jgi:large subunit ribosomal protein L29